MDQEKIEKIVKETLMAEIETLKASVERKRFDGPSEDRPEQLSPKVKTEMVLRAAIFPGYRRQAPDWVKKALSEGTDSAGGYLTPTEYRAELIKRLPELSELYPYVTVLPVSTDAGTVPRLLTDVTMTWGTGENSALTESDPSFEQMSYTIHKVSAICKISQELWEDSNPAISQVVTDLFTEAIAAERDKMIAVGTDSDQPYGIYYRVAQDASSQLVSSIGTLTHAKMVEIESSLKKKYRKNARWIWGNTVNRRVMSIKDENNQPIFHRDPTGRYPATVLGYPISQQDDIPDGWILFGDLKRYYIFDRGVLKVGLDTSGTAFERDQVWIKIRERYDGDVALAEAFTGGSGITGP